MNLTEKSEEFHLTCFLNCSIILNTDCNLIDDIYISGKFLQIVK